MFAKVQAAIPRYVEQAFDMQVSRWALLAKPCVVWDHEFAGEVMKAFNSLYNMIVKAKRNGYEKQFCILASEAMERGLFINENEEEKQLKRRDHSRVAEAAKNEFSDTQNLERGRENKG